jgi:GT2 family glycosyltransferase/glycosyltransferase involved in cell wall biosynthesis
MHKIQLILYGVFAFSTLLWATPLDPMLPASAYKLPDFFSVLVFPIIDWNFRFQRPQHFAAGMARMGTPVYYFQVSFRKEQVPGKYRILARPEKNVHLVHLNCEFNAIYNRRLPASDIFCMTSAIKSMVQGEKIRATITIVDYPHWFPIVERIPDNFVIYDCMDYHPGFDAINGAPVQTSLVETRLLNFSDVVVTTSDALSEAVRVPNTLIRNAGEYSFFSGGTPGYWSVSKPVVGYVGAISHWFDATMVAAAAKKFPEYEFILVGAHVDANLSSIEGLANVQYKYEQPYNRLPNMVASFDVCLIPFAMNHPLSRFTNPVKVYEYLSAGKPVVATAIRQLEIAVPPLVHLAHTEAEFARLVGKAMEERVDDRLKSTRQSWAKTQTWDTRVQDLVTVVNRKLPLVSIIVLTCFPDDGLFDLLPSLQSTNYPAIEILIVNNGMSSTSMRAKLDEYAATHRNTRVFHQSQNMGFAGGNNVGIRHAKGEYIAMVNSDVVVTPGWLLRLVRHLRKNPHIGIIGPVTNRIGNEAQIDLGEYTSKQDQLAQQRVAEYTSKRVNKLLYVHMVAFFCVLLPRAVVDKIGLLDEGFRFGFFEDDDYCQRIRLAGYSVAIADGVFVWHEEHKSMDQFNATGKQAVFDRNKIYYEKKWGAWKPHVYRR